MNVATCSFSTWNLSQCVIKGLKQPGNCNLVYYSASYPLVWSSSEGWGPEQVCRNRGANFHFSSRQWKAKSTWFLYPWVICELFLTEPGFWKFGLNNLEFEPPEEVRKYPRLTPSKVLLLQSLSLLSFFCLFFCFRGQPAPPLWQVGEIDVWLLLCLLLCKTIWCL